MAQILLLNGPNLNLLGHREPALYGAEGLDAIESRVAKMAEDAGHCLDCFQSNAEAALIDRIQQASGGNVDFILINPAAFTHTSIALRDALLAVEIPFIEIHLSNVYQRESFRRNSYFSDIAVGVIVGLGPQGYELAMQAAFRQLDKA